MIKRSLSNLLLGLVLLYGSVAHAQQDHHRYEAKLGVVGKDGFYRIALKPEVTGRAIYWPHDLRILDNKHIQVPFVEDIRKLATTVETDFPIVQEGIDNEKQYFIVIENTTEASFDRLLLKTRNSTATRALTVSGSDDRAKWYAVREDFDWEVQSWNNDQTLSGVGIFTLPTTNYKYLRITFIGKGRLPIKVLKIVNYSSATAQDEYLSISDPHIVQKDSSDKRSYIRFQFDQAYMVNKIELDIRGPKYFSRSAEFIISDGHSFFETEGNYTRVSSGVQHAFFDVKAREILMIIKNEDNPPLTIKAVHAFQRRQSIIAYLEANKSYTLTFGDSAARAPVYDLSYFKDSIGKQIPELSVGPIEEIKPGAAPLKPAAKDYKWLMWVVIGIVLAGLLYMTMRMLQQMKNRPQQ